VAVLESDLFRRERHASRHDEAGLLFFKQRDLRERGRSNLEAFNLAKNGALRDEVARHLKEKFGLEDPQEILNDPFIRFGR